MLQQFEVENFRCFKELSLDGFKRINLITGINNVGKTSLLEALFLFGGAYNPELSFRLAGFRGYHQLKYQVDPRSETPWHSLFHQFNVEKPFSLAGVLETGDERRIEYSIIRTQDELSEINQLYQANGDEQKEITPYATEPAQVLKLYYNENGRSGEYIMKIFAGGMSIDPPPPPPPSPTIILPPRRVTPENEIAERYGKMDKKGEQKIILDTLKIIEPRLKRLTVVVDGGTAVVHGDLGLEQTIPLPLMGEGIVKLASLVVAIGNAPGGFVLIDEIENGIHHSILPTIWTAIAKVAKKYDTQVFATTHSLECISAAHSSFQNKRPYDFKLYRLEWIKNKIQPISYDKDVLDTALKSGLEVR